MGMVKKTKKIFQGPGNPGGSWKIRKIPGLYAFEHISFTTGMVKKMEKEAHRPKWFT